MQINEKNDAILSPNKQTSNMQQQHKLQNIIMHRKTFHRNDAWDYI